MMTSELMGSYSVICMVAVLVTTSYQRGRAKEMMYSYHVVGDAVQDVLQSLGGLAMVINQAAPFQVNRGQVSLLGCARAGAILARVVVHLGGGDGWA